MGLFSSGFRRPCPHGTQWVLSGPPPEAHYASQGRARRVYCALVHPPVPVARGEGGLAAISRLALRAGPPENDPASRPRRVDPPRRSLLPQRWLAVGASDIAPEGPTGPLPGIRQHALRRRCPPHAPGVEGAWLRCKFAPLPLDAVPTSLILMKGFGPCTLFSLTGRPALLHLRSQSEAHALLA